MNSIRMSNNFFVIHCFPYFLFLSFYFKSCRWFCQGCTQRLAICVGRDFEAPTYQTVVILSKCTKLKIAHITRPTYIACCAFVLLFHNCGRCKSSINTFFIIYPGITKYNKQSFSTCIFYVIFFSKLSCFPTILN